MARDAISFKLLKAMAKPGCAVCHLVDEAVSRYLDSLLYENVNDPGTRDRLRASQGFCREHARKVAGMRDAFGLAIIYRDILSSLGEALQHEGKSVPISSPAPVGRERLRRGQHMERRLAPHHSCPACEVQEDVTQVSLQALVRGLDDEDMARAYDGSHGLCLPHLRAAVALADTPATLKILVNKESQVVTSLVTELSEFIRKHDYRFTAEGFGAESDAWLRAIMMMVGGLAEERLQHPPEPAQNAAQDDHDEQTITTPEGDNP